LSSIFSSADLPKIFPKLCVKLLLVFYRKSVIIIIVKGIRNKKTSPKKNKKSFKKPLTNKNKSVIIQIQGKERIE